MLEFPEDKGDPMDLNRDIWNFDYSLLEITVIYSYIHKCLVSDTVSIVLRLYTTTLDLILNNNDVIEVQTFSLKRLHKHIEFTI